MRSLLLVAALVLAHPALAQEKVVGNNVDVRTLLAFKASDAAVQKMLPEGWEVNSPAAGATKGFNLGITLIDQVVQQDSDGKSVNTYQGAALTVPVKKKGTDISGTMVIGGLMTPPNVPGAYGVFLPAKSMIERKQRTADGKTTVDETWQLTGEAGNAIEVELQYQRGTPARGKVEAKVFSGAKPDFYRIYRFELASDVARSTATDVDRVSKVSLKATGAKIAPLVDGSQQLIAVTSVPWYARQVSLPGS
jgi:hypothetical protein